MVYGFAVLAVVFCALWRWVIVGRERWRVLAEVEGGNARYWAGQFRSAVERLKIENAGLGDGRVQYERDRARELLAQTEIQLIDARRDRDRIVAESAKAVRDTIADLGQANERARDLQERLTALEAREARGSTMILTVEEIAIIMDRRGRQVPRADSGAVRAAPACACGCAPECVSPRACAIVFAHEAEIRANERERCARVIEGHVNQSGIADWRAATVRNLGDVLRSLALSGHVYLRACVDCTCSCEGTCTRCHPRLLAPAPGWEVQSGPTANLAADP